MTTTIEPPQQSPAPQAPWSGHKGPEQPEGRNLKKLALIGAAILIALVAAFFILKAFTGDDEPKVITGTAAAPFKVTVPKGWKAIPNEQLASLPGKPLGVLQREDGTGFFVVRRDGTAPKSLNGFTKDLDKEFAKRVPDFQKRSTRNLKIKAGNAYFYSYIRKTVGTVHSVVVIPVAKGSYVLNTVAKGGKQDVAKELGRMIVNFDK